MNKIRLGSRGSPLALRQAETVRQKIEDIRPGCVVEIVPILTSGDWRPEHGETRLSEKDGGKGLFAKEIEKALFDDTIDVAVHSLKDMDSVLPDGLCIPIVLEREDPADALICSPTLLENQKNLQNRPITAIEDLPKGCTIGTSSVRRQAFLLSRRPDLNIVPLRGNVQTRLDKLSAGQVDATLLAIAGLNRLDMAHHVTAALSPRDFTPAAAQGTIGLEIKTARQEELAFLNALNHFPTQLCIAVEREALRTLDGSCHTPIGAHAHFQGKDHMHFRLDVASLDGRQTAGDTAKGVIKTVADAKNMGQTLALSVKNSMPGGILKVF